MKEYSSQNYTFKAKDDLQTSENQIFKLENELEKKRLAKIDS